MTASEDLQAEQQILDTVHQDHRSRLNAAGVLGRALEHLDMEEAVFIKPVLVQQTEADNTGAKITVTELKVGVSQRNDPREKSTQHRFIPISKKIGNVAIPIAPFTTEDATLAESLVSGLRTAKDMDVLPNLSDDLGNIFSPDVEFAAPEKDD